MAVSIVPCKILKTLRMPYILQPPTSWVKFIATEAAKACDSRGPRHHFLGEKLWNRNERLLVPDSVGNTHLQMLCQFWR